MPNYYQKVCCYNEIKNTSKIQFTAEVKASMQVIIDYLHIDHCIVNVT